MRSLVSVLLIGLVSGCANLKAPYIPTTQSDLLCEPTIYELGVSTSNLDPVLNRPLETNDPLLFLSGGGQNGAFGAGLLAGWKEKQDFPEFAIVTGVSTGALQSVYAFTGDPDILAEEYMIADESEILNAYVKDRKLGLWDYITVLRKGSVGDLSGLHNLITENLTEENFALVEKINMRYLDDPNSPPSETNKPKALLLVAATSVDDGKAKVFDMTELANRIWLTKHDPNLSAKYTKCFADILTASSAVPMAAQPVFIDNKMYIDGGLRFSVTNHRVGIEDPIGGPDIVIVVGFNERRIYVVLNGVVGIRDDCDICGTEEDSDRHKDWSFLELTQRSIKIFIDQIEQFSINKITDEISMERESRKVADICSVVQEYSLDEEDREYVEELCLGYDDLELPSGLPKYFSIDAEHLNNPEFGINGKGCAAILKEEQEEGSIVEFHPKYMECLISYGRKRAYSTDF